MIIGECSSRNMQVASEAQVDVVDLQEEGRKVCGGAEQPQEQFSTSSITRSVF